MPLLKHMIVVTLYKLHNMSSKVFTNAIYFLSPQHFSINKMIGNMVCIITDYKSTKCQNIVSIEYVSPTICFAIEYNNLTLNIILTCKLILSFIYMYRVLLLTSLYMPFSLYQRCSQDNLECDFKQLQIKI